MVSRRSIFSLRLKLKTQVILFLFLIVFISVALLYRAVSSQDTRRSSRLFPSMEKRPVRFRPKHIPNFIQNDDPLILKNELADYPLAKNNDFLSLKDRDLLSANSRKAMTNFLATLYPTNWKDAPETDEVAFDLKYLLLDFGFESKMSCKEIDHIRLGNPISFSSSKYVEYGYEDGPGNNNDYNYNDGYNRMAGRKGSADIVVKSPASDQETKIACMKQIYDPELCATMGNYRFLREVLLLSTLHHPGILTLKGYCLRGLTIASRLQSKGIVMVTELGTPITESHIQMGSYTRKLSMALQVSRLLLYLETNPLSTLQLTRLHMKDFVLVKESTVKLADLDDLELGERTCSYDSDCVHQDSGKGVSCVSGVCQGYNTLANLDLVSKVILLPILHATQSENVTSLVERLQKMDISTSQLASSLKTLVDKAPPDRSMYRRNNNNNKNNNNNNKAVKHMGINQQEDAQGFPVKDPSSLIIDDILTRFVRHNGKNFAGIYDYPCAGSRVTWGCVFTVTSLKQAATLCAKDVACRSFVVFTTLPESETLMTIVLKNDSDIHPTSSSGTTLFIKMDSEAVGVASLGQDEEGGRGRDDKALHRSNDWNGARMGNDDGVKENENGDDGDEDDLNDEDEDEEEDAVSTEIRECLDQTLQTYESARYSREKRLMAHLGLKGIREQSWRISAFNSDLGNFSHIHRLEGGGGRLTTKLVKRRPEDKDLVATRATFMAEDGPGAYHVAYAWVYHMDRILGFYHTPPCVGKPLAASTVDRLHNSFSWEETFRPLIESDGSLSGMLIALMPKVMNLSKLTLLPLAAVTQEVVPFERPQKLQLEYVLLWWLAGMNKAESDHLGYKGHLIHFQADKAFVNTSLNMSDYLNHCQFPNVAYKSLLCFRCKQDAIGTSICHFAEEAANRVQAMFEDEVELDLQQQTETRLSSYINQVASTILTKVDSCIKKFGRDKVLY